MSHDRGLRLQNALARYLTTWWPSAESAGAGRPGSDVLGTPGIAWENKTAKQFRPLQFVRQAQGHAVDRRLDMAKGADGVICRVCRPAHGTITELLSCQCAANCGAPSCLGQKFGIVPVVVYWPEGVGEASVDATLSILPTGVLVRLLKEAGY